MSRQQRSPFMSHPLRVDTLPVIGSHPSRKGDVFLFLFFAGLCILALWTVGARAAYFESSGVVTSGTVRNLSVIPGVRGGVDYYATFSYPVNDQCHVTQDRISGDQYSHMYVGQAVTVRYIADDPQWAHMDGVGDADIRTVALLAIMGGMFLLGAARTAGVATAPVKNHK